MRHSESYEILLTRNNTQQQVNVNSVAISVALQTTYIGRTVDEVETKRYTLFF